MSSQHGFDGGANRLYSDARFAWRPKRIWIPAWQFGGLDYETTTATDIKSIGVGAGNDMAITEVNTSNITGIAMANAADTVETLLLVPGDLDTNKPTYFRVYWTANNTSGSATFAVLYKAYVANSTVVGSAAATTALDTTIAATSMAGVAYTLMQSAEGVMNGNALSQDTEMVQLSVKLSALTTITTAYFLGLEIRYSPRRLRSNDGMKHEATPPKYIGSSIYSP